MQRLSVKQVINLQALVNRTKAERAAKTITRNALSTIIKRLQAEEHKLTVDINTSDIVIEQMVSLSAPANCHRMRADGLILYAQEQDGKFFNKKLARKVLGRARRIVTN